MVSVDKIGQGVANYLDAELMPKLKTNGFEKVLIGTAASIAIRKSSSIVEGFKDNKIVQMLGIMDGDGNIDVDMLVEEIKKNVPREGFNVDVPLIGTLTFKKDDIDKIHDYIGAFDVIQ